MSTHWLLRVGNGNHFNSSSKHGIWGITSTNNNIPTFMSRVKENDILWFVQSKMKGKLIAVATFVKHRKREIGPLLALTPTNEELGWVEENGSWDTEVHFKELFNLSECELYSEIKSPLVIREFDPEKCKVNLPLEYTNIVRYSKIKKSI